MASKTINLYMNFLIDKDQVCLWAEQVLLQRKHVRRLVLDCVDRSNIGISRITQAVIDCNPEELFCESSDIELKHLNQCSRFRCLKLVITECNPEKLALSSIILELHHLKELDLKCRDVEKKQFLDVSRILTGTGICKVRFELEESIEDFNDPEWGEEKIPVYLGDNELELAAVLKSQGFSFRASLKLRNTDEDDPEEWLSALVTRFNGNTILRDFEPAKIAQVCTMASQNIDLTICIPDVAALWVEQLRIQRKLVHRLDLQSFPPRIIAVVPDLNPEELRSSSKDILLEDLKSCTRLRRLELELLTGSSNGLVLSAILVQLPNLRVLELTSADKKSFIGVTQALPATYIHRVRYEYNPAIENEDMWGAEEEDSYYIGDEENEFVDLFSKASFVFKAVVMKRNTSEFVKKEWIEEEGFWHRMAVGNGESRR
ncbi:hypothetical protein HDU99_003539 [Rhizoclosmatium hyalinum]|nr:hypothetical protein HDU99_003539 [Rhizoclosmatium hyalinum]